MRLDKNVFQLLADKPEILAFLSKNPRLLSELARNERLLSLFENPIAQETAIEVLSATKNLVDFYPGTVNKMMEGMGVNPMLPKPSEVIFEE